QICQFQKADTPERLEKFIARLEAYPAFMDANIGILREGIETGLTSPRIVAERTVQQLERLLAIPIAEAIVPSMAQVATDADREKVRDVVRDVVYPADAKFLDALRDDYLPATRTKPRLWSAPGREALNARGVVCARRRRALPDPHRGLVGAGPAAAGDPRHRHGGVGGGRD